MKEKVNVTGVPETMVQTLYAQCEVFLRKGDYVSQLSSSEP